MFITVHLNPACVGIKYLQNKKTTGKSGLGVQMESVTPWRNQGTLTGFWDGLDPEPLSLSFGSAFSCVVFTFRQL